MNRLQRALLLCLALVLLPLQGFAAARMAWQLPEHPATTTEVPAHSCHADGATAADNDKNSTPATHRAASSHCGGCCLAVGLLPRLLEPQRTVLLMLYRITESPLPGAGTDPDTPHKPPRLSLA